MEAGRILNGMQGVLAHLLNAHCMPTLPWAGLWGCRTACDRPHLFRELLAQATIPIEYRAGGKAVLQCAD